MLPRSGLNAGRRKPGIKSESLKLFGEKPVSFDKFYAVFKDHLEPPFPELFFPRPELISFVDRKTVFDVVVVGGGINGCVCARLSALHGMRTLLLEGDDYGVCGARRAPEVLYRAFQKRPMFGWRAGREEKGDLCEIASSAPHLLKQEEVLICRMGKRCFEHLLLCRRKGQTAGRSPRFRAKEKSVCVLDDRRFVLENMLAARQEGAVCLNHARVNSFGEPSENGMEVGWTDMLTGDHHDVRAGAVLNCTGSLAPYVARLHPHPFGRRLTHVLEATIFFSEPWSLPDFFLDHPALPGLCMIKRDGKSTRVSIVMRKVLSPTGEFVLQDEERDTLIGVLQEISPHFRRDSITLEQTAIRSFLDHPTRGFPRPSFDWVSAGGVFHLLGGAATSAYRAARAGLARLSELSVSPADAASLEGRVLPGSWKVEEARESFMENALRFGVSLHLAQDVFERQGALVRLFGDEEDNFQIVGDSFLRGELEMGLNLLQAETVEDLLERRLGCPQLLLPGNPTRAAMEEAIAGKVVSVQAEERRISGR